MFVLKNGDAAELSGANCHAKLSHLKQLLKNIHPPMSAQFGISAFATPVRSLLLGEYCSQWTGERLCPGRRECPDTSPPVSSHGDDVERRPTYPDGVGECQRDGERQSLWNSDDEDRDTDDEEAHELLQVLELPRLLVDHERLDREA